MALTKPDEKAVEMTAEIFEAKYPGIYAGVHTKFATEAAKVATEETKNMAIKIKTATEAGYNTGVSEGMLKGATEERNRIKSVQEKSYPGFEAIIKEKAFDGKSTGPETAEAILLAMKDKNAKGLNAMKESAPDPIDNELEEESNDNADPLKAAWETGPLSAKLKKEFGGDWDSYKAFYDNNKHYQETKQIRL